MIFSNTSPGSKVRTPKPGTPPSELAVRFLELQRLRRKVYELEKLASERQPRRRPVELGLTSQGA
jgi:hypothetical protein